MQIAPEKAKSVNHDSNSLYAMLTYVCFPQLPV